MRRTGVTLVESLFALAIGAVVIGGALALLVSVNRAGLAGELAGAQRDAGLTLAMLERDALRALAAPDGSPAVRVTPDALRLAIGEFASDGGITASVVSYVPEPRKEGGTRLRRTDAKGSALMPGLFDRVQCERLDGAGSAYLRVTLSVSARPGDGAAPAAPAVLSGLFRLAALELPGSALFTPACLDDVPGVLAR